MFPVRELAGVRLSVVSADYVDVLPIRNLPQAPKARADLARIERSLRRLQKLKLPRVPKDALKRFDREILGRTAQFAAVSPLLDPEEREELQELARKAMTTRAFAGIGHTARFRTIQLIRKAGPETLPNDVPPAVRRLLGVRGETEATLNRHATTEDPLTRIERLHRLRGKPLSEEQYARELVKIMGDPALPAYAAGDQVDRLAKVHELHESGALTDDQVTTITALILDAR